MPIIEVAWEDTNAETGEVTSGVREIEVPYKALTKYEFLAQFTDAEKAAALALRATYLAVFWLNYDSVSPVGPAFEHDHQDTTNGMAALVATGVLTEERAAEIMTNWKLAGT